MRLLCPTRSESPMPTPCFQPPRPGHCPKRGHAGRISHQGAMTATVPVTHCVSISVIREGKETHASTYKDAL